MSVLQFDFPKEVGLFRKIIHDNAGFERYWKSLENAQCAYMSVYGFRAVKPNGRRAEYNTAIIKNFVLITTNVSTFTICMKFGWNNQLIDLHTKGTINTLNPRGLY